MKFLKARRKSVKVVKIGKEAIEEIIKECLLGESWKLFGIKKKKIQVHIVIERDATGAFLYAYSMDEIGQLDFGRIDEYIRNKVDITTHSIYTPPQSGKYYKTIDVFQL